jgi:hypothetical protein
MYFIKCLHLVNVLFVKVLKTSIVITVNVSAYEKCSVCALSDVWCSVITQICSHEYSLLLSDPVTSGLIWNIKCLRSTDSSKRAKLLIPVYFNTEILIQATGMPQSVYWLWVGYELDDWRIGVRFSEGVNSLSLLQGIHNGSGAHPASYSKGTGAFRRGQSYRGLKQTTHLLLVLSLGMHAAMSQFAHYIIIVWYVIKWQGQLYFLLQSSYLNGLFFFFKLATVFHYNPTWARIWIP